MLQIGLGVALLLELLIMGEQSRRVLLAAQAPIFRTPGQGGRNEELRRRPRTGGRKKTRIPPIQVAPLVLVSAPSVGAFEAMTHLAAQLDAVSAGEQNTIAHQRQFNQGQSLGGISIAELRDQGRR